MNGNIRRHPHHERVDAEEALRLLEKVRAGINADSWREVARHLSAYRETSSRAWEQLIHRAKIGTPVSPLNAEVLYLAAGEEPPPPPYRQKVYRVTGFDPWLHQGRKGAPRNWFYIRHCDAVKRQRDLRKRGLFIEWAEGDTVWRELPTNGCAAG
jgi:hypothetical protein